MMTMKKLKITIIDLIHNSLSSSLYQRVMFNNFMGIMPQIIAVWCRQEGHKVSYSLFTGHQGLKDLMAEQTDLVFISSFTFTAQLAYALSNFFRSKGIPTVLGGPHGRCYPDDASYHFDYVLGLTNKELLIDLLHNFELNRRGGTYLSSSSQPASIPGVRERWDFIEKGHQNYSLVKSVPMIASFGCPYKCDYCIDSEIPFQTLDMDTIREDLQFLVKKMRHPRVSWYDPNFGINFNLFMDTIESAVSPGQIDFFAESSLSVLNEKNVVRMKRNGFKMIMPGIESWFDYGNKSNTSVRKGMDKVVHVAEQINMIQRYIPQVQTNFMFGFDSDNGSEPFELTKRFIDLAPAAYPAYALLSVFGQKPDSNSRYRDEKRIIPFPFHYLRSVYMLNIIPMNYTWEEFYLHFIDLLKYSFSKRILYRRFNAVNMSAPKWIVLFLSITEGGKKKIDRLTSMMNMLNKDNGFKQFVNKESGKVPAFMINKVRRDLGYLWQWLPDKSLAYDIKGHS
jgi:hypothetical protein